MRGSGKNLSWGWGTIWLPLLLASVFTRVPALAHLPTVALANANIEDDGRFSLNLTFDLPPFVCGVLPRKTDDNVLNAWLDRPTNGLTASLVSAQARIRDKPTYGVIGGDLCQGLRQANWNPMTSE